MKITPTGVKSYYEINGDSLLSSVTVQDNLELMKEYTEVMERFNILQCKLGKLYFNEFDAD